MQIETLGMEKVEWPLFQRADSSPTPCRLIVDPPQSGPWNMAVDEVLLDAAADRNVATLRFYQWSEPTLSLGYFQLYADRERHPSSLNCAVVRRSSGGGAILHDREITYSLAVPASHPCAKDAAHLYDAVHHELIVILRDLIGGDPRANFSLCKPFSPRADEPFLCFERRAIGDVLIQDKKSPGKTWKIAGSAQRRRRGAVLQHGSVLLEMSPFAPELPGIAEVAGISIQAAKLIESMTERFGLALKLHPEPQSFNRHERFSVERTVAERFALPAWTKRR